VLRVVCYMLYHMYMKYFFILGSNPTLSLAEIYSLLGVRFSYKLIDKDCLLVEGGDLDETVMINQLGGTIKIGRIAKSALSADLLSAVRDTCQPEMGKKFFFGFSTFGKVGPTKALAMKLKKALQSDGISSRWVVSKDKNLSSAAVEQSGLLKHGMEIVLIKDSERILVGVTKAIQPFKDWSFRDYGRPGRDDYSGMLPPKLARIMLNLAKPVVAENLLDPFCGSGTVLSEAVLLGCTKVIGSDISLDALEDTKNNLAWLKEKYQKVDFRCQLYQCDARKLYEIIDDHSVSRVVTEPYLGPSRNHNNQQKVIKQLNDLYSEFLVALDRILKPGGRAVMVWPVFVGGSKKIFMQPSLGGWSIAKPLPEDLVIKGDITARQTIVYGRVGQKVWREIVILVKK